jgi:hypothetical protein
VASGRSIPAMTIIVDYAASARFRRSESRWVLGLIVRWPGVDVAMTTTVAAADATLLPARVRRLRSAVRGRRGSSVSAPSAVTSFDRAGACGKSPTAACSTPSPNSMRSPATSSPTLDSLDREGNSSQRFSRWRLRLRFTTKNTDRHRRERHPPVWVPVYRYGPCPTPTKRHPSVWFASSTGSVPACRS